MLRILAHPRQRLCLDQSWIFLCLQPIVSLECKIRRKFLVSNYLETYDSSAFLYKNRHSLIIEVMAVLMHKRFLQLCKIKNSETCQMPINMIYNGTLHNSHNERTSLLCINIKLRNKVEYRMVCTVEYYFYKMKTTQKFYKLSGCIYVVKYINIDRKDTLQIQDSNCFVEGGQRIG